MVRTFFLFSDKFYDKYKYIFLILILVLAFFLRVSYLDYDSMWIDETISSVAASAIVQNGYPTLESGAVYDRALLFHYLMAFFMLIFGENDFGARFVSVVFGVLTCFLAYLFGKKFIGSSYAGLVFAFFIAISSIEIIYSKQARMYQGFQFFYFLSFYLFYKFIILKESYFNKRIFDYFSLAILIFLTIHLQFMGYILIPLFALIYFIHNFSWKNKLSLFKDKLFYLIIFSSLIGIYFIFSHLKLNFDFLFRSYFYGLTYIDHLIIILPIILLCIVGVIFYFTKDLKFNLSFLSFSLIPFIGLFFVMVFGTRYIYFIFFPIFFYLTFIFEKTKFKQILLLIFILFYSTTIFDFNEIKQPNYDITMPHSDFKGTYEFIYSNESLNNMDLVTTWAPGALWYGEKPQYWIYYSVSGFKNEGWTLKGNNSETFTGAKVVFNVSELPNEFIFTLDTQAARKIDYSYHEFINESCSSINYLYNIETFICNK